MQYKGIKENKICNIKEFRVKFNNERMTLEPNLVLNLVMFWGLYRVILDGKFKWYVP